MNKALGQPEVGESYRIAGPKPGPPRFFFTSPNNLLHQA
jgi:hypothetical protein